MIMWDAENGGGSACCAMGRRAVIVNELAGYGFNREPDGWIMPCGGGAMFMDKYKCIYAVEWIVNVGTSTIGDEGFPG